MQYGKLEKEACLTECIKINHEIPSMNFIETEKLKSVKKETDLEFHCCQQFFNLKKLVKK